MRHQKKVRYVAFGFLVLVALLPLATAEDGWMMDIQPLASLTDRERVSIPDEMRELRRLRSELERVCIERVKKDPKTECPDINDAFAVRTFLKNQPISAETGTGATEETTDTAKPVLTLSDLTDHQRALLRRYERVQKCPEGLDEFIPGLFTLCASRLVNSPRAFRGFTNDRVINAQAKVLKEPLLKDMIEMFKGSRPTR